MVKHRKIHHRCYAELYPLANDVHQKSFYIGADGNVTRHRVTFWSKPKLLAAVRAFKSSPNSGMLMDHALFIENTTTED